MVTVYPPYYPPLDDDHTDAYWQRAYTCPTLQKRRIVCELCGEYMVVEDDEQYTHGQSDVYWKCPGGWPGEGHSWGPHLADECYYTKKSF
jgi:hypothetical protein